MDLKTRGNGNFAENQPAVPNKSGRGLKAIIIVLCLLLVIALGVIAVLLINNGKSNISIEEQGIVSENEVEQEIINETEDEKGKLNSFLSDLFSKDDDKIELKFFYSEKEDKTYLILNGEVLKDTIDGKLKPYSDSQYLIKTLYGDVYFLGCYAIKDKKLYKFTDDILNKNIEIIRFSNYGEGAAFICEDGFVLYRFETDKKEVIYNESDASDYIHSFAISPDAKSVLYMTYDYELYLYKDGESKKIDDGFEERATAVAVSNDGEFCYVFDVWGEDKPFYCYNSNGDKDIILKAYKENITYPVAPIALNIDNTQVSCCFYDTGEVLVYDSASCVKNKYHYEVSDSLSHGGLIPSGEYQFMSQEYLKDGDEYYRIIFSDVKDLNNCFYIGDRNSYRPYYKDGDELKVISENKCYTTISSDKTELISLDDENNTLYYTSLESREVKEIINEVACFGVTPDFEHIFYITNDDELYVSDIDGSNKKKLDDDVCGDNYTVKFENIGALCPRILGNKHIIYGTNDGNIYMCDINGEKTIIKAELNFSNYDGYIDDYSNLYGRVMWYGFSNLNSYLFPNRNFITYIDNGDLYKIDSNGKTSLLLEDVE